MSSIIREYIRRRIRLLTEDKRGRVKAMGFPAEFADLLHNFYPPWTHKYADWIAQELKREWVHAIGLPLKWMVRAWDTQYKEKFAIIFQWLDSKGGGPKLNKMTFDEAYKKAWLLPELEKSEKQGEVMITFPNGWKWVNLKVSYCKPEAVSMGHCANDNSGELWSLRDNKGYPHVTCTVTDEGEIVQMKGRNNSVPKAEYHPYIIKLLSSEFITGIATEKNEDFHLSDLTEEQRNEIKEANPDFDFTEKLSTVDLLQEGDPERLREEGVFATNVELTHISATFTAWSSEVAQLFAEDKNNSRRIAGLILDGDWENSDILAEDFDEQIGEDYFQNDLLFNTDFENKTLLFEYFQLKYSDFIEDEYGDVPEPSRPTWSDLDLDDVFEKLLEEDDYIREAYKEGWVEMRSNAQSAHAKKYILRAASEVVDGVYEGDDGRLRIIVEYNRLAEWVDMHHPGTPIDTEDLVNMIDELGSEGQIELATVDVEEFFGGDEDEEDLNNILKLRITRALERISPAPFDASP